ncbi:hypothetical protein [Nonomuraea sp. B1E8]|uniref:hypothetical protein n=1 Tax=unclassified Nonomuraea TaxID=2593643 RepID=UPI00325DFEED
MQSEELSETSHKKLGRSKKTFVAPLGIIAAVVVITAGGVTLVNNTQFGSQTVGSLPVASITADDVRTDVTNDPPRNLIAAGRVAMSAYWTGNWKELGEAEHKLARGTLTTKVKRLSRTWHVYNPQRGTYEPTPWSWVDVAPGLQKAAVLEGELPSKRLGVLDLATQKALSWIDLPQGAASVTWSPDGKNILVTHYDRHPDEIEFVNANMRFGSKGLSPRSGFSIVDTTTMQAQFHSVTQESRSTAHARNDFSWAAPDLISSAKGEAGGELYFGLNGEKANGPSNRAALSEDKVGQAGISPNGKLLAGPAGMPTKVVDRATGQEVGSQRVLDLLAWADDSQLIALGCEGNCADEFHNGLVLVSVDGKQVTPLSAYRKDDGSDSTWHPVLTLR